MLRSHCLYALLVQFCIFLGKKINFSETSNWNMCETLSNLLPASPIVRAGANSFWMMENATLCKPHRTVLDACLECINYHNGYLKTGLRNFLQTQWYSKGTNNFLNRRKINAHISFLSWHLDAALTPAYVVDQTFFRLIPILPIVSIVLSDC